MYPLRPSACITTATIQALRKQGYALIIAHFPPIVKRSEANSGEIRPKIARRLQASYV